MSTFKKATGSDQRPQRTFKPALIGVQETLESRLVLSTAPTVSAVVATARAAAASAAIAQWNNPATWSFVNGQFSSSISSPLISALNNKKAHKAAIIAKSVDSWSVTNNGVMISPGAGSAGNSQVPLNLISFQFNGSSNPSMTIAAQDGTLPIVLTPVSATKNSITFQGQTTDTSTATNGSTTSSSLSTFARMTKTSAGSFRLDIIVGSYANSPPLMTYTARRV